MLIPGVSDAEDLGCVNDVQGVVSYGEGGGLGGGGGEVEVYHHRIVIQSEMISV